MQRIRAVGRELNSAIRWAVGIYLVSTFVIMIVYVLISIPPSGLPAALVRPTLALVLVVAALTAPSWLMALVSLLLRDKSDAGTNRSEPQVPTPAPATPNTQRSTPRPPVALVFVLMTAFFAVQYLRLGNFHDLTIVHAITSFVLTSVAFALLRWRAARRRRLSVQQS